jgi:UDP-glucuronate 4-epimerase
MTYQNTPFEIINLGNFNTVSLNDLTHGLEEVLGVSAIRQLLPEQPGDVPRTWADIKVASHCRALLCLYCQRCFSDAQLAT